MKLCSLSKNEWDNQVAYQKLIQVLWKWIHEANFVGKDKKE